MRQKPHSFPNVQEHPYKGAETAGRPFPGLRRGIASRTEGSSLSGKTGHAGIAGMT